MDKARDNYVRLQEWPFNSDTKYMMVKVAPASDKVRDFKLMKVVLEEF